MKERGFTLVELAIVLVIIGIILGAVMKGRDLIDNARAKRLAAELNRWTVAMYAYMDQKGKLPGDSDSDGYIDSDPIDYFNNESFVEVPKNTLTLGSVTFYLYPGVIDDNGTMKNVIFICAKNDCSGNLTGVKKYIDMVDVSFDGKVSPESGTLKGIPTSVTVTVDNDVVNNTPSVTSYPADWGNATAAFYTF